MKKKFASLILVSLMMTAMGIGLMPGIDMAAYADDITTYNLRVDGVQVTSENMDNILAGDPVNDGKVSFTPAEDGGHAVLTLNGINLQGGSGIWYMGIVYSGPEPLDVVLLCVSDNRISCEIGSAIYSTYGGTPITIKGTGKLTLDNASIYSEGDLIFESGTVIGKGNGNGFTGGLSVIMNGGTVISENGNGISVGSIPDCIQINGGRLTASVEQAYSYGAFSYKGGGYAYVKNAIPGTRWQDAGGTYGEVAIPVNTEAWRFPMNNKKVQFGEEQETVEDHTWDEGTVIKEATCTEKGSKTYTCTVCKATKTEETEALGHKYGEWTELDDEQHQRICERDTSHVESAEHSWDEGTVTKEATCTEKGIKTYACTACTATRTEEIDALGHDWDEPTYEWSDDNSKVTATRICKRDSSHIETETVDTTSEVTKEATETEKGERTYTAVFDNPAFAEQTKKVEIPKLEPEPTPAPEPEEYTITYNLNGGKYNGSTENITEAYESGTTIKIHAKPTRDGYTFLYWKGSEYQPGDEYTVTEDHVFTAQWEKTDTPSDDESTTSSDNGTTTSKKDSSASAKTGDENDITSLLMLMITSIVLIAAMGYRRRNN